MGNFKYKAMNDKGERIEGTYVADSREAVMDMISSNNYYPLKVEEIVEKNLLDFEYFKKVKIKDIAIFCRQFYTMLDAGSSINTALHILAEQLPNKKLKEALAKVEEEVRKGATLSEAMKEQKYIFPPLLISMVETGEVSGNLDLIMLRMANHYEKENKINNKIRSAMIYPMVLGFLAIAVVNIIIIFVMPIFIEMFTSSGVVLPLSTKILLGLSNFMRSNWILVALATILLIFSIKYYLRSESGQQFINRLKLTLPILKGLNEKIVVSRFTRTLSTLLASGITLVQGLQVVSSVIGNSIVEEELLKVREKVMKGEGLSEPIKETKRFPLMLSSMIKIGEESGSLDEILNKTADFYDEELETAIQAFTVILEPIMLVIMGAVIGFLIISIIQPMFGMYNTI